MIGHIHPQHWQHRAYEKSLSENLKGFVVGAEGVAPDYSISPKLMILNSSVPCDSVLLQKKVADIEHCKDM